MAQTQTKGEGGGGTSRSSKPAEKEETAGGTNYDDVVNQIAQLKADIGALTATLGDLGRSERDKLVSAAMARGEGLRATGEAKLGEARGTVDEYIRDTERYVREQPTHALGIAAVIGFFLGLFMSRR